MHQNFPTILLPSRRQRCMVWRCHDGRQRLFYWSILAAFLNRSFQSLIIDSRDQNQSFCLAMAAHIIKNDSLPIPSDTQHHLLWRQSGLCDRLWYFTLLQLRFFWTLLSHVIHFSLPIINLFKNGSIFFHFSSNFRKLKFGPLNFLVSNRVTFKHKASLCIQLYANIPK